MTILLPQLKVVTLLKQWLRSFFKIWEQHKNFTNHRENKALCVFSKKLKTFIRWPSKTLVLANPSADEHSWCLLIANGWLIHCRATRLSNNFQYFSNLCLGKSRQVVSFIADKYISVCDKLDFPIPRIFLVSTRPGRISNIHVRETPTRLWWKCLVEWQ